MLYLIFELVRIPDIFKRLVSCMKQHSYGFCSSIVVEVMKLYFILMSQFFLASGWGMNSFHRSSDTLSPIDSSLLYYIFIFLFMTFQFISMKHVLPLSSAVLLLWNVRTSRRNWFLRWMPFTTWLLWLSVCSLNHSSHILLASIVFMNLLGGFSSMLSLILFIWFWHSTFSMISFLLWFAGTLVLNWSLMSF